jgi:hypothetical protein
VYVFWKGSNMSTVRFYCCKGIGGAATGEAHTVLGATDSSSPFSLAIDMSQFSTEGTRELYVDYRTTSGTWVTDNYTNFTINVPDEVQQPQTVTAQVTWTVPTRRTDGTPLAASEIDHFELYVYNNNSGAVSVKQVPGTASSWSATFVSGQYSFGIVAVDDQGLASAMSPLETLSVQ